MWGVRPPTIIGLLGRLEESGRRGGVKREEGVASRVEGGKKRRRVQRELQRGLLVLCGPLRRLVTLA